MASQTEWPQSLKDFANRAFAACTDSNRKAVSEELRALIFESFQKGTIQSTDWSNMQLKALASSTSKPSSSLGKLGKLAFPSASASASGSGTGSGSGSGLGGGSKKTIKKRNAAATAGANDGLTEEERERKEKRAKRFEREQEEYRRQQDDLLETAIQTTSLAGRFGGASSGAGATLGGYSMGTVVEGSNANGGVGGVQQGRYGRTNGLGYVNHGFHGHSGGNGGSGWAQPGSGTTAGAFPATGAGVDAEVADPNVIDWDKHTVVGTSTKLEKPYLRLTSAPDPKTVRPLATLLQTLELLKTKWRTENNYNYICDQFKSMRQDLTVQRIKNAFTVKVYEIHARIALEMADLGEYNQCQSQLRALYAHGITGNHVEFLAYRILYLLHTKNRRDVNALMSELTPEAKAEPAVEHALAVRSALVTGNYHAFFRLYTHSPNMNAYIMDHFVERERINALLTLAKAYRPSLTLQFISDELAFDSLEQTHDFLSANNAAVYIQPTPLASESKPHAAALPTSTSTKKKKSKPQPSQSPQIPLEAKLWDPKAALDPLATAIAKYRKIDIKGQI
ncbi:hypothetical protein BCV70DRAFT_40578 [Testicularia cyperi]|uniref:PCI domain-containing protein n=1 Tax=Testicularia cyperi TaxID=1882483 RepID=A0A317XJ40_9BASI|nr:hypothetical protein BCV70DRAFT_40578 [Testicularia cyperi]